MLNKIIELATKEPVIKYAPIMLIGILITFGLLFYVGKKIIDTENKKEYGNLIDFARIFYFICASTYFYLVERYFMILIFFGMDIITNLILKRLQEERIKTIRKEKDFWYNIKVEKIVKELREEIEKSKNESE